MSSLSKTQRLIFRGIFPILVLLAAGALWSAEASRAQNAAAAPSVSDQPPTGPAAALRDALAAACAQNQDEFSRYLTARNALAFNKFSAAARMAFLKRFVLLDEPGTPAILPGAAGTATIRCKTPSGAADIHIGAPNEQDNVALIPVEVRESGDTSGADAIRVQMGLVREKREWKLLSLGLVFLDLPALAVEWDKSSADANERAAVESIKAIADAVEAYRQKYLRLPVLLANLASPKKGAPSDEAAGLLDNELVTGARNGYTFRYVISGGSALGAPAKYEISATPVDYPRTGVKSYFRDTGGAIHAADHHGQLGSASDPVVESLTSGADGPS